MAGMGRLTDYDGDNNEEVEEVEVYIKVKFRIQSWDGTVKEHEADLPGEVQIRDLKEELRDELGDPVLTEWYIERTNTLMLDGNVIHGVYSLEHEDVINVRVRNANSNVPEMTPVMEGRRY